MKVTILHSWCMSALFALSAIAVEAQDVVIRRPMKPATTTTSKPSSSTNKPSRSKPKPKPEPANPIGEVIYETFTANGISFKMIRVEGGTFKMGATSEQGSDADDDEKPAHQVTLSSYYIGETEVTQALWQAVMGTTVSQQRDKGYKQWSLVGVGTSYPMYFISWDECQEFVRKLNSLTGRIFRLPTEAEWEFAARGGNKSRGYKFSGSNSLGKVAWYHGNSGLETHPVKTKSPNELGIYDMCGNVRECCQDRYGSFISSSQTNPSGDTLGSDCVYRGGCWGDYYWNCRVSSRSSVTLDDWGYHFGFRLAL